MLGCQPDKVGPKQESNQPNIGAIGENEHPMLDPTCSDTAYMRLKSANDSYKVNYCGLVPCAPGQPEWGSVMVVNGVDSMAVYFTMALGWFIDASQSQFSLSSNFSLNTVTGRPEVTNDFISADVNPLANKWALFVDKTNIEKDANNCFACALNLTVVKTSFFGGVQQGSQRLLWGSNPNWNVAGSKFESNSEFLLPWCWQNCAPAWPAADTVCVAAYAGLPGNAGCATLTPDVTGATAPITYAWSSGETSASLTACPTATTNYGVSVTDANGPFSVTEYTVNVVDAGCRSGNSPQHKVLVCHIPPGNPNNPQEICIDWNGVPAHVARFRAPGSNPRHGHDSGCEIGRCGSNPCD